MSEVELLQTIVYVTLAIFVVGLGLRFLKQPAVVIYIIAGVVLGSSGLHIIESSTEFVALSELGVVILLFFIGMHVSLPKLIANWRITVIGTFAQIGITVGLMLLLSIFLNWPLARSILIGFVISLSSTAVILKILQDKGELETKVGQNVIGILLVQDFAFIPMIIILDILGGEVSNPLDAGLPIMGGIIVLGLLAYVIHHDVPIRLPFSKIIRKDHEIQVFLSLVLCFGFALITSLLGISAALGAFLAGIFVSATKDTEWVSDNLKSFHVIFVALFFVYIGTLIDVAFIIVNWQILLLLVSSILLLNTVLNAVILRFLGDPWNESIYAGALLAQVGEFSFLLGTLGLARGIILESTYAFIISLISLSLLFSPLWIVVVKRSMGINSRYKFKITRRVYQLR